MNADDRFHPPRADLSGLEGYHSPQVDVAVRLNTNESPYPPPAEYVEALATAVRGIPFHRYPDRGAQELRSVTAKSLGQPAERVFCANGSNEVLQTLLLAYGGPGRRAALFRPTYLLHEHIARITGTEVVGGARRDDFSLNVDEARELLGSARPHITFLCTPNNPTGVVDDRAAVEAVIEAAPGLVIIDEAYGEFAPWTALDLVRDDLPLVVVRTFSKVWSLAGLRLGCCVAPPSIVADLERVALPYHLSSLTQVAGRLALDYADDMRSRVDAIVNERERMYTALTAMTGVTVWPSGANFLLMRTDRDAKQVWHGLVEAGVLVRDASSWRGLEGCLRVSVGTPEENDAFLASLAAVLNSGR